jgi:carbon starvation protein CstA
MADGVDFVHLPTWKIFLIQLLNIAGVGPIFGPILGALYGPVALIWIVIGTIFAGGVHDYFSGMLSLRNQGESIPEVVGHQLGRGIKLFMRGFSVILLLLVGIVFVSSPAQLLTNILDLPISILIASIFAYYFLATMLPIDKIIGRIYPFFAGALLFMAIGLIVMLAVSGHEFFPQHTLANLHPQKLPLWPLMFITIACGAISGFHATQSPMMARCLPSERLGKPVFYGAMIIEGVIALIWATLASSFYHSPAELNQVLSQGGPALVVNQISNTLMGHFGGILAIIGVVILPISSGDTAFRSARLIIADFMNFSQKDLGRRLAVAVPLFVIGFMVSKTDFSILWRYFGWANQTLATIVLWTAAAFLKRQGGWKHWIATLPALFMTVVVTAFLGYAKIGFKLPLPTATIIGLIAAAVCLVLFFLKIKTDPEN